jgi:hypothetical protein
MNKNHVVVIAFFLLISVSCVDTSTTPTTNEDCFVCVETTEECLWVPELRQRYGYFQVTCPVRPEICDNTNEDSAGLIVNTPSDCPASNQYFCTPSDLGNIRECYFVGAES